MALKSLAKRTHMLVGEISGLILCGSQDECLAAARQTKRDEILYLALALTTNDPAQQRARAKGGG